MSGSYAGEPGYYQPVRGATMYNYRLTELHQIVAPQAQLFETAKDRRRQTEALFKQVVKFEQIDPFWSILGDS